MLVFPTGKHPYQSTGNYHRKKEILGTEESPLVDKKRIEKHLDAIAQCGAGGEDEDYPRLPYLQLLALLYGFATYVETGDEHEHGNGKMIGHHEGEHDIAKGVEEHREEGGVGATKTHYLTDYPVEEYPGVIGEEHKQHSHYHLGHVLVKQYRQSLVEKIERILEEGE